MIHKRTLIPVGLLLVVMTRIVSMNGNALTLESDERARAFITMHEQKVRPPEIDCNRGWWTASITGKDQDYKVEEEAHKRYLEGLSDTKAFAEINEIRKSGVKDPVLARQIEVLYLQYLEKQLDPNLSKKISEKAAAIEKTFNDYRANINGQEMTLDRVRQILEESKDSSLRKRVWEASMAVGLRVEKQLMDLVALRNEAAKKLGFKDYHEFSLRIAEQDPNHIQKLFDELDWLTRESFLAVKKEIDESLARVYGLKVEGLPWLYLDPFFQKAPATPSYDLNKSFAKVDIVELCRKYFLGIGLPIDGILARSDLYAKKGKNAGAFATDLDREGDVRVFANVLPNDYWMGTMLREFGRAVYSSKFIPATVPYVLRTQPHPLINEGFAVMMEKGSKNADWLAKMGAEVDNPRAFNEACVRLSRLEILLFSRWCQVMFRFEREMYTNPNQDLRRLWYHLVEKYQALKRPQGRHLPDFAACIQFVSAPASFHNSLIGRMFAAQLHHAIARDVLKVAPEKAVLVGNRQIGRFLREKVFAPGAMLNWSALTKNATGEELNPWALAAEVSVNKR